MATIEEMKKYAIAEYASERLNQIFASYGESYAKNENLPVIHTPRSHVHACDIWQSTSANNHVAIEVICGTMSAMVVSPRAWEEGNKIAIVGEGSASIRVTTDTVLSWLEYIDNMSEED